MKGIELAIVGEHGGWLDPGETGEICFSSPALTPGYVSDDPEVSRAFRGGWFHTGDLGHVDEAGRLYVTGRSKLFISTSGFKVDPFEVENVLRRHPAVADVVVVGSRGPLGEEVVKAVVVRAPGHGEPGGEGGGVDGDDDAGLRHELLAWCRAELAVFKVPRIVEFRAEIPRSPLGKILRKYLV
jgi:long-chain acyl-CoA synthetase